MNNLNTVLMEGTLIRDPERSNQVTGSSQCRLSLANNRYYFGKNNKWVQDASFFTVWVSGPVAESCLKFLKKGRGIRIVGRLKQLRYSMGGFSREKVAILAEHIEFQPVRKTDEPEPTEPSRIPGELTTKSDSSIMLEEQTQAEVPASQDAPRAVPQAETQAVPQNAAPPVAPEETPAADAGQAEAAPAEGSQVAATEAEVAEARGPESFEEEGPDCASGEDVPETDATDTPF